MGRPRALGVAGASDGGAGLALPLQLALARWASRFDARRTLENYRRVMRLNIASAGGLALYIGYRMLAH